MCAKPGVAEKHLSQSLPIVRSVSELRARVAGWRSAHRRVALVPTMGALHAGHLALVTAARERADRVVASIFVNPRQFGPAEDLDRYPRDEAGDVAKLASVGCDLVYAPTVEVMYPPGFGTRVLIDRLGDGLCGAARPGHFDGVGIVVTKLLTQAQPDLALFGEKDWQQLAIIRRLVADLDLSVEVDGVPIVRDTDGLALSSRNGYLSAAERAEAPRLNRQLVRIRERVQAGERDYLRLETEAMAELAAHGWHPDYVTVRRRSDLQPPSGDEALVVLAAARLGTTRLIDNLEI